MASASASASGPTLKITSPITVAKKTDIGSLDGIDLNKIVCVFDLDDTLIGEISKEPLSNAVEFIVKCIQLGGQTNTEFIFFILTANTVKEDVAMKVNKLTIHINSVLSRENTPIFSEIWAPKQYNLQFKKTYDNVKELYYEYIRGLYPDYNGDVGEIPYPVFFFDNLIQQVNSVRESARDYIFGKQGLYLNSILIDSNLSNSLQGKEWENSYNKIQGIVLHRPHKEPYEIPLSNEPLKGGKRKKNTRRAYKSRKASKTRSSKTRDRKGRKGRRQ